MITTLRELNRTLPDIKCVSPKNMRDDPQKKSVKFKPMRIYKSPYLEPQIQPVVKRSKKYPKLFPIGPNFKMYAIFMNPEYIVPNEEFRWFQSAPKPILDLDESEILKLCYKKSKRVRISTNLNETISKDKIMMKSNKQLNSKPKNKIKSNEDLKSKDTNLIVASNSKEAVNMKSKDTESTNKTDSRGKNQLENGLPPQCSFNPYAADYQAEIVVKSIVRDLIDNRSGFADGHPCCNSRKCVDDFYLYLKMYEEQKEIEKEAQMKYFENGTSCSPFKINYANIFTNEAFDSDCLETKESLIRKINKY